ncbi:response regulator [Roseiconus nitratireducens]|uniref:histidine kinase n=1 Tax=Roseiconus nitratireducens TaxID=2605748 RepID=A0A5M6D601_9BACT|nr:response regulator [Roseiconus nitratireducens]KAA5542773.1 response regulator [Roseiconus nitratireducens]
MSEQGIQNVASDDARSTYESLVNTLPLSVLIKDLDGRRLFANQTYLELRGLKWEDVIGKTDADLFPEEIANRYSHDDQRVIREHKVLHDVEESVNQDGKPCWIERIKSPIFGEDNEIIGIQLVFWDVTARHLAERELQHERHLLNALLKNIPDSIYFKDRDSRFMRISKAMAHKFGFSGEQDVVGKTDADIFTAAHAEAARSDELRIIESGNPLVDLVERETWPNRDDTWCISTKMPLFNDDGEIIGTFGISRDITELKRYEDDLREARDAADAANKAKGDFLANMSHEIRTPMNAIIGMSELLAQSELKAKQYDYVHLIRDSAESLLQLLNEILDFSKIESRKLQLESISFSLRDLIEKSGQTLAIRAAEKNLELACRVAPNLPDRWVGDPGRLRQVLINLIGNAIKFTDEGEVVVDVSKGKPHSSDPPGTTPLRFSIRDTGIGIPKDKQASVLDPFTQADASTTRRFGGTGLGLAISRQLVELMHGELELKSRPGQGTEFYFTAHFPLADEQVIDPKKELNRLAGLPVLLVDDNQTNLRILKEIFSTWRLKPALATGGSEALDLIREADERGKPYALAVLDCMMPGMDGFELAKRIRETHSRDQMKLIILSSATSTDDTGRCEESQISRYMTKPVIQSELLDAVLDVMHIRESGEPRKRNSLPSCPHLRVLVAEDGLANQQVAIGMLEAAGHSAVVVSDGRQAVAAWKEEPFDLILMDMHMPIMDGLEASEAIRNHERTTGGHIPIVALTAAAMKEDAEACLKAGMDAYLAKPIHHPDLQETMARFAPEKSVLEGLEATRSTPDTGSPPDVTEEPSPESDSEADPPTRSSDIIDLGAAASRIPHGLRGVRQLAKVFVNECTDMIAALHESVSQTDGPAIRRTAHTLKGSANLFSAKRVHDAAEELETAARNEQLDNSQSLLERLETEVEMMLDELNRFMESGEESSGG